MHLTVGVRRSDEPLGPGLRSPGPLMPRGLGRGARGTGWPGCRGGRAGCRAGGSPGSPGQGVCTPGGPHLSRERPALQHKPGSELGKQTGCLERRRRTEDRVEKDSQKPVCQGKMGCQTEPRPATGVPRAPGLTGPHAQQVHPPGQREAVGSLPGPDHGASRCRRQRWEEMTQRPSAVPLGAQAMVPRHDSCQWVERKS